MVLEVAILNVKPGSTAEFEKNFEIASEIISKANGFLDLQLKKCMENTNRYILLVNWKDLESHTEGFRKSKSYADWKELLHQFYDPFPIVEHYTEISEI